MAQVQSLVKEDPHELQVVPEKKKKKKVPENEPSDYEGKWGRVLAF